MPAKFQLVSEFEPAGDQPKAIAELVEGYRSGKRGGTAGRGCKTLMTVISDFDIDEQPPSRRLSRRTAKERCWQAVRACCRS